MIKMTNTNLNNNRKMKRFLAYMIDMVIITILIVGVSKIDFLHPKHKEYNEVVERLNEFIEDKSNTTKLSDEEKEEYNAIVYEGSKYQASYMLAESLIVILYFTLFPLSNKGMTVGKRLMKLQMVRDDEKASRPKFWQYLVKAVLCPISVSSLLRNGLTYVLLLGGLLVFSQNTYLTVVNYGSMLVTVLCYLDIFKMLFNEEGKGISDKLAKVKVIDYVRD